jgi:poly [ADP-ribose] polymerase
MSEVVKEAMYVKSNAAGNNNKFWHIAIHLDNTVHVKNGRVGSSGQTQPVKSFSCLESAETFYNKKCKEKEGKSKGYTKAKVLLGEAGEMDDTSTNLAEVAMKQIEQSSPDTAKLIKHLSKVNIHHITSSTTIKYDESKGTFRTPLGIVTQEGIDEARVLLDELIPYVEKEEFTDETFIDKAQQYLQIIPRKVGRKLILEDLFPNVEKFQQEIQILDSLDASLQQVLSAPENKDAKVDAPKIFDVKVDIVDDKKIIDRIVKFYNSTRKSMHTSYNLRVKNVYAVSIGDMQTAWDGDGAQMTNIKELWHGTRAANLLSILKGGLMIPKSSAGHVTGRMFGDGVYFSDQSTKSLNYSQGYWSGARDNHCFMFLADVAMGKEYVPSTYGSNFPRAGYDSTYAVGGKSGVSNNEMIVYRTSQCNLKYLVEFDS